MGPCARLQWLLLPNFQNGRQSSAANMLFQLRQHLQRRLTAFPRGLLMLLTLSGVAWAYGSAVATEFGDRYLVDLGDKIVSGDDNMAVDRAIKELENAISAGSVSTTCSAVGVMGIVGSKVSVSNGPVVKRAVDAVVGAMTHDEESVRHAAAKAFSRFAGISYATENLPKVVALLDDENEWVADQAATCIGEFGKPDTHVRDALVASLDRPPSSDGFSLRATAASVIGRVCKGDREAERALETQCRIAAVGSYRHECALALIRLNPSSLVASAALLEGIKNSPPGEATRILTWLPVESLTASQVKGFIQAAEQSDSPKVLDVVRALQAEIQKKH
jgi:hypothetical protein